MTNIKKNAVFNVIKTLLSFALPLLTFPYVSKVLMPTNLGKVNWSVSFVEFFSLIASLGISTYAIRICSSVRENKKELNDIASQIFSINIITSIISYAILFVSLLIFKEFQIYKTLVIIQSLTIVLTTFGADWINQAMEDFKFITLRTIACQMIYLLGVFIFIKDPNDYIKYAVLSVATSSGCYLINIIYIKKYCNLKFTFNIDWGNHIKPIMELFIMQLAQVAITSFGVTLLGVIKSDYEVGIYSFAYSLFNMIAQLTGSILWVLLPRLSLLFSKNDYDSINELLSDIFGFFMLLGLPCATGLILFSKEIILVFTGAAYLDSVPAIVILMISFLLSLVGDSFFGNMVLLPSGKEKLYMYINCAGAIFNVIANYFLINLYGYIGTAIADVLTTLIITLLVYRYKDSKIRVDSLFKRTIVPFIGCLLIIVICLFGKLFIANDLYRIIICVPLSVISYLITMILFKNEVLMSLLKSGLKSFK